MKGNVCIAVSILLFLCACKQTGKNTIEFTKVKANSVEVPVKESLYEDLNGNHILLTKYKGKRVLLNFWATWCKPCIEEMPALLRAKRILEKENYIFLLASDQSVEKIKTFKEEFNFEFNFIRFTGSFPQLKIYALPKTFIYNEKGEKVDEISGAVTWDSQEIINRLKNVK
ncbi:TlpA disulfide reductase family protein [Maribacter sp.]|uniref:TlpA family protein disulfide reductase n=1 Tax=Maribacter sp. TaxID=1897614 RepID=UPI0025C38856|nr:TlpA disulfide reductase family protein [Maribacter sp.]